MLDNLKYIFKNKKLSNAIILKEFNCTFKKYLRTSIFKDDDIYLDPLEIHNEELSKTNYLNSARMDDCVYNRSNVGMNTIIINNKYMHIKLINKLYKELRDSEVNYTKRFIFLTSLYNNIFNYGYNLYDLLKILEIYQKTKDTKYAELFKKILQNINDLAYLIFSYKKPLISYCNGKIKGSSGFLSFLSNNSSSYFHSFYSYNNLKYSFLPYGGISYILANLRGSLGFYLALTGQEIKSSDLIWCGLTKRWLSEDSLEMFEITSESQLEVSEQDANILLEEHFLKAPQVYTLKNYEEIIHEHFKHDNLIYIMKKLDKSRKSEDKKVRKWAEETYEKIYFLPPLATHITFEILNILRNYKIELLKKCQVNKNLWKEMIKNSYKIPRTKEEVSMNELKYTIDRELFNKAINLETNTFLNFISCPDILNGITSYLVKDTNYSFNCSYLNSNIFEIKKDIIHYFIYYKNNYEFLVYDRPDISFSSLSVLEKYNQNYNIHNKTPYDKLFFAKQNERWSDDYLKDDLEEINKHFS
ncbi:enoyl-CoA hydratase-related protein, putative [Plasmodium gallinaceum]|uniref:Enoyl-CoA hydratase-related protein, putative n=1 Tax=Plasmodium gallinaceum TaxID=5849 RepID=A0A1J1GXG9_PLAGA|nr:enoyl-CoA hydratase-related protein, putative [Plasmodium gallinaceum]CRG97183.1 enoyl-CoA hydratase-related protein, putative [Plasmodium gallinaceum]